MSTTILRVMVVVVLISGLVLTKGNNERIVNKWTVKKIFDPGNSDGQSQSVLPRIPDPRRQTKPIPVLPPKRPAYDYYSGSEEEGKPCVTEYDLPGECIPYHLCDAIDTTTPKGIGIIDIRIKDRPCESVLDVCCLLPGQISDQGNLDIQLQSVLSSIPDPRWQMKPIPVQPLENPSYDSTSYSYESNSEEEDKSCITEYDLPGECVPYYLCNANDTIISNGFGIIGIRTKDDACESVLDVCCLLPGQEPPKHPIKCGYRNPEGVSMLNNDHVDGYARFGEFNWMLAIFGENRRESLDGSILCGGSLIHPQIALTAAHCVHSHLKDKGEQGLTVRAGEWILWSEKESLPHQDRQVIKIFEHPNYVEGPVFYDAALLFLDSPFARADNVGTVCLPEPDEQITPSIQCFTSGWGKDVSGNTANNLNILKKVELPFVTNSQCQKMLRKTRLGKHFILNKSFMCAGGESDIDTCVGDGGSPLVCPIQNSNERYIQMGIVAWGIDCGKKHIPGVYGNVRLFRQWIDQTVVREGHMTDSYQL